jgi:hypothetical protein
MPTPATTSSICRASFRGCDEGYDLVMGNRFAGGIEPAPCRRCISTSGNPILSALGRIFFSIPVRDFHCGLRAFRATGFWR